MDTFHFTRMRYNLIYLDPADYVIKRSYTQHSLSVIIGAYSKAIFGFGVGNEYESARRCAKMALQYTSNHLPYCNIKFDGSQAIWNALIEAGVPKDHLLSVPKDVCRSHVNECEGLIRILRSKGLSKRDYSFQRDIFLKAAIIFISWNLFENHTLFDGRWSGRLTDLLKIDAPSDWNQLITESWRHVISRGDTFEKYYPHYKRGPGRIV
jgi:hypothetical protein